MQFQNDTHNISKINRFIFYIFFVHTFKQSLFAVSEFKIKRKVALKNLQFGINLLY